jgi:serine/threonine protein kinase
MSRFYRSPEVIALSKSYGKASDVWSLGLVFLDLLLANKGRPTYLFRGKHCAPISPNTTNVEKELDADH